MRLSKLILAPAVFVLAALITVAAAWVAVDAIERLSKSTVENELILQGEDWATVQTDGLQVVLSGMAPTENRRFRALSVAGSEVDSARVIDRMEVPSASAIAPPRFSIEILRNDAGISMIGLIPAGTNREELNNRVSRITPDRAVADLLESADYPVPEGWDDVLNFSLSALEELPRSKISVDANRVEIEAIADSAEQKRGWETDLARRAPGGLRVSLNISAPRPVISPFTARFVIDEQGARFDACTAHTEPGRTKIVAAGIASGVKGRPNCTIGLGVPSPDWPDAVSRGVQAVRELGAGTITFSDADVTLVAAASVPQQSFDRVVGELEADLPDVFSLHATKVSEADDVGEGPPEFVATLSPEGLIQLRGRLANEQERKITESVARARFGITKVYSATRLDPDLPMDWSTRVLAAVEALSYLANGVATVKPDVVELRGKTGDLTASAEISRHLSEKLGEAKDFRVNVTYEEALDPLAALPTPRECVDGINEVMREAKITFAPGSVEIEASAAATIDKIADILRDCPEVPMEIGGHTDSQGGEEMNKSLSQQRANAVLNALLSRRILTSNLTAHGYGEEQPVGDNDTEEGREENRRIEFRLIGTEDLPEASGAGVTGEGAEGDEIIEEGRPSNAELSTIRPRQRPETDEDMAEDTATTGPDVGSGDEGSETVADEEGSGDEPATGVAAAQTTSDAAETQDTVADLAEETQDTTDSTADETETPTSTNDVAQDETATAVVDDEEAPATPARATEVDENDPAATNLGERTDAAEEAPEKTETTTTITGPPVVVHPELEGVKAPPRPDRQG